MKVIRCNASILDHHSMYRSIFQLPPAVIMILGNDPETMIVINAISLQKNDLNRLKQKARMMIRRIGESMTLPSW